MLNFCSLFQFVNVIVHHAFPTKDSLLFAYEFGLNNKANGMYSRITDKWGRFQIFSSYFSTKTSVVGTQKNCHHEKSVRLEKNHNFTLNSSCF